MPYAFASVSLLVCWAAGPSPALAELGRHLFYDTRLSVNGEQSCASCHRQELAFTDGRARAVGVTGVVHPRSAMSLVNLADAKSLTWNQPALTSLARQALIPMFSTTPVELGLRGRETILLRELRAVPRYRELFARAFPERADPFSIPNIAEALAAFQRSIHSRRSPYDRFHSGNDRTAISQAAQRGEALFFSSPIAGCFRCHSGPDFSDGQHRNTAVAPGQTQRFKTPTLRNIALTAPYMHDGSLATLEAVLDHYAGGGHLPSHPAKDPLLTGFYLSPRNRLDLIEFLHSLTDAELLTDARFANPW